MPGASGVAVLLALIFTVEGRSLQNIKVSVRELETPEFVEVAHTEEFPNLLPLSIHADGEHVVDLLLSRHHTAERGFPIHAMSGEFETIPAHAPVDAAIYIDKKSSALFGVKRGMSGNREYEGSFAAGNKRLQLSRYESKHDRRSSDGHIRYRLTRVEHLAHTSDGLTWSGADLQRALTKAHKRADEYYFEAGILVDYSEYKYWLESEGSQDAALEAINYKFAYTLAGVEKTYATLEGLTVVPYFTKLIVNTVAGESIALNAGLDPEGPSTQVITSAQLLDVVAAAAQDIGLLTGTDVDVGFLWGRYDLCDDATNADTCAPIGVAYTNAACDSGKGYGSIEDRGMESWAQMAHEMAHSLGANHDGSGNSCGTGYVMSPTAEYPDPSTGISVYQFSSCTSEQLASTVPTKSCLGNSGTDVSLPVVSPEPGEKYDADTQCKMMVDSASKFYDPTALPAPYTYDMAEICWRGIPCIEGTSVRTGLPPADGTDCGSGKKCGQGVCS